MTRALRAVIVIVISEFLERYSCRHSKAYRTVTYLEIGQGGGHIKGVWGTEVLQMGPEAELLWGLWAKPSDFWNLNWILCMSFN